MVAAGGTGGHIFPAKAVAQCAKMQGWQVLCAGTRGQLERDYLAKDFSFIGFGVRGLRGQGWLSKLVRVIGMGGAWLKALFCIMRFKPNVMLCMGGYVTVPLALAAWCWRVPVVLHEQNSVAGLSNLYLSRIASCVLEAFPNSFPHAIKTTVVGNPVRQAFLNEVEPCKRLSGREGPFRVLIVGGSQGALALNQLSLDLLASWDNDATLMIRHQTGRVHYDAMLQQYQRLNKPANMWRVLPFIEDMAQAYAWADVIICRSGALTVAEICMVGLPAIFIPYPLAVDDHQRKNAAHLVAAGAAWMHHQSSLNLSTIKKQLVYLMNNLDQQIVMAQAACALSSPRSTLEIVSHCEQVALAAKKGGWCKFKAK